MRATERKSYVSELCMHKYFPYCKMTMVGAARTCKQYSPGYSDYNERKAEDKLNKKEKERERKRKWLRRKKRTENVNDGKQQNFAFNTNP